MINAVEEIRNLFAGIKDLLAGVENSRAGKLNDLIQIYDPNNHNYTITNNSINQAFKDKIARSLSRQASIGLFFLSRLIFTPN